MEKDIENDDLQSKRTADKEAPEKKPAPKKKKKEAEDSVNNTVEINPTMNDSIKEAVQNTVVLGWGRMNPITTGHEKLVNKVKQVASQEKGVPQIYLSHSTDPKKNPLSYNDKVSLAQKAFGNMIVKSNAKTIIQVMQELQKRFKNVVLVVGSDRVDQFDTLLNKYNGKDYSFDSIKIVSAGERDPDADDVSGMSASKMRALAAQDKRDEFKKGLPSKLRRDGDKVFDMVRAGMKLAEELESEGLLDEAVLSYAQRRQRGLIMRKYKTKIAAARKRAMRKAATMDKLKARARKKAINIIRQKVAGNKGTNYAELSPGEKMLIDKRVAKKKAAIDRIAKRMIPTMRKMDMQRLSGKSTVKEDVDALFEATIEEKKFHEVRKKDGTMKFDGRFRAFRKKMDEASELQKTRDDHKDERASMMRRHKDEIIDAKRRDLTRQAQEEFADDAEIIEMMDVLADELFESVALDEQKIEEALITKAEKSGAPLEDVIAVYEEALKEGTSEFAFDTVNVWIAEGKKNGIWELEEGVNDPGIFKAVFLAGGPGSGKSFIVGKTALTALGLKLINSDDAFEAQLKKVGLKPTPEDIFSPKGQEVRGRAKSLTGMKQQLALKGRLGLVIDGTGKDYDKIKKQADELKKIGYEVAMIFVNTDLDTAQARNKARERTLPEKEVEDMWNAVQRNIGKFQNYFGSQFIVVDNSNGANYEGAINSAYKKMSAWVKKDPAKPAAKKWIRDAKAQRGIKEGVEIREAIKTNTKIRMAANKMKRDLKKKGKSDEDIAKALKINFPSLQEAYKSPKEAAAFEDGKKAARKGVKYADNPHKKGTPEHLYWSKGHNKVRMREEVELDEGQKPYVSSVDGKAEVLDSKGRTVKTFSGPDRMRKASEYLNKNFNKLRREEVELDEAKGKLVKNMRVKHIHNGNKGTVVKGGDRAGGRVEVEYDNGQTVMVSGKFLEPFKEQVELEERTGSRYMAVRDNMHDASEKAAAAYRRGDRKAGDAHKAEELRLKKKLMSMNRNEEVDLDEAFENFIEGPVSVEEGNWATKAVGKVVFKSKYKKAAQLLRQILDKKEKEGKAAGLRGMKHSPEYYAARVLQTTNLSDKLDARTLAKMATEGWTKARKDAIDCDNPKGFSERAYCAGQKKQANENAGGEGTPEVTKKYVKDTPYQVIPNGVKKQKDGSLTEEVSQKQIKDLEVFADRLLNKFGIDVEFTRHFADRMNDARNNPEIKISELQQLFKKIAKNKGKNLKQNPDTEVVLKDMQKDLNLPVVIKYRRDIDEFEVVNKTIMRKKNFATSNKTIEYK